MRRATVGGHTYEFPTLVELMARATPARSGDVLAGCAAESAADSAAHPVRTSPERAGVAFAISSTSVGNS